MTVDPRAALDRFVAALETHYEAVAARRGSNDQLVDDAYDVLEDAFDMYDEALAVSYGELLPFSTVDEDDDFDEDDEDDEDVDFDEEDE
nr:hypothetical protein [Jonesia quinghaiensis]